MSMPKAYDMAHTRSAAVSAYELSFLDIAVLQTFEMKQSLKKVFVEAIH
jgi:hypothetical protein